LYYFIPDEETYSSHAIGSAEVDYDGTPILGSHAWLSQKSQGQGFVTTIDFDSAELNLPCNTRVAFTVSYIIGVDDFSALDSTEVILMLINEFTGSSTTKSVYRITKSSFAHPLAPHEFSFVIRNLECSAEVDARWKLSVFNGNSYPFSSNLTAPASLMHYSTVIDRFVPIKLVATDFILGDNVQVDDDSSSVSIGAAFGIAPLDGTLIKGGPLQEVNIPVGQIQVEFVLEVSNPPSTLPWAYVAEAEVATIQIVCESDNNTILQTRIISTSDFADVSVPTTFTLVFDQTYHSSQPLSFRIVKSTGHGLIFSHSMICAHTDGSPCANQVEDSCPDVPSPAPTTPAPATECINVGGCCLYSPCCDGATCVDFGLYKLCVNYLCPVSNKTAAPTPTPTVTSSPVVAQISTVFSFNIEFWEANRVNLEQEYTNLVLLTIRPWFAGSRFGRITVTPGSLVVSLEWLNVPQAALTNPGIITGILPNGCFDFPPEYYLAQVDVSFCKVSFLRLCGDGSLVDITHGICPSAAPAAEPTEPITSSPTAVVTDPPTVAQANAARQFAESAAKTLSRNINVVIGVLAALFFTLLLLCCFHQYRRDKLINQAIKELSLPDDDLNISLGSSTELSGGSSLELSNLSFNESSVPSAFPPPHSPASPLKTPPGEQALFGTDSSFENWDDHFPAPSLFSSVNVPPSMNVPPSSSDNPHTSSDDAVSSFSASSSSSAFRASSSNDLTASQMSAVWNLSAKAPAAVPKEIGKAPAAVARSSLVSTTADASSSSFNA